MKKWAVLVLLGVFPCLATAGTTIEEMNRAVGGSGLASQLDDSDLEKVRAYGAGDFDGRNQKIVTSDERLKKQLSTDLTMTDQDGKVVRVQVTGAAPAVSEAEDVSSGVNNARVTNGQNAPAAQGNATQHGVLQNVAGKVIRGGQPAQTTRGNQPVAQDYQGTATAPVSGKQGGGVYFPGRSGQGGLGGKVPPMPSSGATSQPAQPLQPAKQPQPAEKKVAQPTEKKVAQPAEKKEPQPTEKKVVQSAAKTVLQNRAPVAQPQSGRQPTQPAQDFQNTPTSGRQGIYYPGRPGQGSLDSYVPPVPGSGEQPAKQPARPSARQATQVTTTHETATLSGPQGEGASEAKKIMEAAQGDTNSVTRVPTAVSKMSEEDRHKYYMCLRQQSRAKKARAAGITIDIGACENMELDKIKLVREGEMSQEEMDARADELAAQSLRNAKQMQAAQQAQSNSVSHSQRGLATQQPQRGTTAQQPQGRAVAQQAPTSKAQQAQKESLQKKTFKVKQKQLKKANKECSSYTYDDICTECCDSYGGFSGNLEGGHCVCR